MYWKAYKCNYDIWMHQIFNRRNNFILKKAPGGTGGNWKNRITYYHPCLNFLYPSLLPYSRLHLQWGVFILTVQQLWALQTKWDMQDGYIKKKKKSAENFKTRKPDIHCAKSQSADWVSLNASRGGEQCRGPLGPAEFLVGFEWLTWGAIWNTDECKIIFNRIGLF